MLYRPSEAGIAVEGHHVMPHYQKGQALLLAAQLLMDWYHRIIDQYIETGTLDPGTSAQVVKRLVDHRGGRLKADEFRRLMLTLVNGLTDQALSSLKEAWKFLHPGTQEKPPERPVVTGGDARSGGAELSCFASIAQVLRMQNPSTDRAAYLHVVARELGDHGEMLAHRERLFAAMQRDGSVVTAILQDLSQPEALGKLSIGLPQGRQ